MPLRVLVRLRTAATDVAFAETRDVSARGIYFYTNYALQVGQDVECILVLPEELTQSPTPMLVTCAGKVLRIETSPETSRNGVAVEIFSYDFSSHGQISTGIRTSSS